MPRKSKPNPRQLVPMYFAWSEGTVLQGKVDPNELGRILYTPDANGRVGKTPDDLVEIFRPEDHPYHNELEWRDDVCGKMWRRTQASYLIRHITVQHADAETGEEVGAPMRAVVSVPDADHDRWYVPTSSALMPGTESAEYVLEQALMDLENFVARYSRFLELAEIIARIRPVINRLRGRLGRRGTDADDDPVPPTSPV